MLFCAPFYQMLYSHSIRTNNTYSKYNLASHIIGCIFKGTNDITLRHMKRTCCQHTDKHAYHVCYVLQGQKLRMLGSNGFG
jgi:hypothetical protein